METVHYPKLEDYWAQYWTFCTLTFSCVMLRDRFSLILKFLHIMTRKPKNKKVKQDMIHYIKDVPLLHH